MVVQDDAREEEVRKLFELERPGDHSRGGTDAILRMDGEVIEFELKSTTKGSVTTVRDFGPDHLRKWERKHWLIGRYDNRQRLQYCLYGSPTAMRPWIQQKAEYVAPDFRLADLAAARLADDDLVRVCGDKDEYTLQDAQKLQKRQYSIADYRRLMDRPNGYSRARMLEILRDRLEYLCNRGSTLNNPHIPENYFNGWEKITDNHATRLRDMVKAEMNQS